MSSYKIYYTRNRFVGVCTDTADFSVIVAENTGWDLVNIRKTFRLEDKRKKSFDNDLC
jgi:hypothetical protein